MLEWLLGYEHFSKRKLSSPTIKLNSQPAFVKTTARHDALPASWRWFSRLSCKRRRIHVNQRCCRRFFHSQHLVRDRSGVSVFPRTNHRCCNSHFQSQMAGCEIFRLASCLYQCGNGFDVVRQRFRLGAFPRLHGEFDVTCASCNTQQSYCKNAAGFRRN